MEYGLIGEKLGHSFSKRIHAEIGNYPYELCEIPLSMLPRFFKYRDFSGINVTIPYKEAVIPYLDRISEEAELIGAVNTVVNRDGILRGYNTDFFGLCRLIEKSGISFENKKVIIIGTGGTSKTAYAAAKKFGASDIVKVSRTPKGDSISYSSAEKLHGTDIIINTTPVGMFPHPGFAPVSLEGFDNLSGVIDVIYNPLKTKLVSAALEKGIPAVNGLYMLVCQALCASELFLNVKYADDLADSIYERLLR